MRVEAGTDGTLLSYDKLSRRASAEYVFNGQAIKEIYGYSSDGFLQTTSQNGALVATRALDALGRTVKAKDLVNLQETQTDYDPDNRLTQQRFFDGKDASRSYTLDFAYYDTTADTTASLSGKGALAKTLLTPANSATNATTTTTTATVYTYEYWDSALQSQVAKIPVSGSAGYNASSYDANGHIRRSQDTATGVVNTYFTTASGLVLERDRTVNGSSQTASHHYFYYADDHRIGDVADTPEDLQRVSYAEQLAVRSGAAQRRQYYRLETIGQANVRGSLQDGGGDGAMASTIDVTRARSTADFDANYEPINDSYPSQAGATYTVRSDRETLYAVAQAVWGDRSLWYLIAEANGLQANATLKAGQLLFIPNKVANIHNNSQTWRPYNAGEAIGPTDPMLPYYAAPAAVPLASAEALRGQPSALLEQALAQLTAYNPDDNPANWGSGGGDRMGDYAFIEQWSGYHNNPYIGTSPSNATYGRGLDAYMQAVATREAKQQANIPVDPFATELRPASVSFDVRGANAGPEWHGKAWGAGSAPTQGVGPWSSADYRNGSDIESDNFNPASAYGYRNGSDVEDDGPSPVIAHSHSGDNYRETSIAVTSGMATQNSAIAKGDGRFKVDHRGTFAFDNPATSMVWGATGSSDVKALASYEEGGVRYSHYLNGVLEESGGVGTFRNSPMSTRQGLLPGAFQALADRRNYILDNGGSMNELEAIEDYASRVDAAVAAGDKASIRALLQSNAATVSAGLAPFLETEQAQRMGYYVDPNNGFTTSPNGRAVREFGAISILGGVTMAVGGPALVGTRMFAADVGTYGLGTAYLMNASGVNAAALIGAEMTLGYSAVSPSSGLSMFASGVKLGAAGLHPGRLAAMSSEVSQSSVIRALRQAGTPDSLATAKLISTGRLGLNILEADPSGRGLGGLYRFGSREVEIYSNAFAQPGQAAGYTTHEAMHFMQGLNSRNYNLGHEFDAFRAQGAIDTGHWANSLSDQGLYDFLRNHPVYRGVRLDPNWPR